MNCNGHLLPTAHYLDHANALSNLPRGISSRQLLVKPINKQHNGPVHEQNVLTTLFITLFWLLLRGVATREGGISVYIPPPISLPKKLNYVVVLSPWPRTNSIAMTIVNIYTHPNQIPGYAPATTETDSWPFASIIQYPPRSSPFSSANYRKSCSSVIKLSVQLKLIEGPLISLYSCKIAITDVPWLLRSLVGWNGLELF